MVIRAEPAVRREAPKTLEHQPARPAKRLRWDVIIASAILLAASVALVSNLVKPTSPEQPTSQAVVAPPDPGATPPPGNTLRFAEFGCDQVLCTIACNEGERVVNVYTLNPGAAYFFEDDRRVTVRPYRLPSNKIVLICTPE